MNRFLINCAWDIMDLGKANGVDNSVARDMFVENLSTFGTDAYPAYPGADVDYAALSAAWNAMDKTEQADAKISCANFMKDCYDEISETRRVGSPAKFYDIAAHYEAEPVEKPNYILYTHAWVIWDKAEADGTDLVTAQKAYVETLEGWGNLSEAQQADEAAWFALKVAPYDKGLQYARLTDLVTAQKAYVETLEGWGNLSEAQQADEAAWFALKVAPYDKGLQYARLTGDRALFESILASR